jgi:hypothetical protein
LRCFDLGYTARRLRFMIAGLSWWYRNVGQEGFPPRHDLDEGKRILYDALERLGAVAAGRAFDDPLRAQVARHSRRTESATSSGPAFWTARPTCMRGAAS